MNILGLVNNMVVLGAERSSIKHWVDAALQATHLRGSDDPLPEQGFYFRSDHFPFAKAGVPAVNIEVGDDFQGRPAGWSKEQFLIFNQQHYHQPSDEYRPTWDMQAAAQHVGFIVELATRLANSADRPRFATQTDGALTGF